MRYEITIEGTRVLTDQRQFEALVSLAAYCEQVSSEYLGSKGGRSQYTYYLEAVDVSDTLKARPMTDDKYQALRMVTTLRLEKQENDTK